MSFNDTVWWANGVNGHIVNATTQTANYLKGATTGEIRWSPTLALRSGTKLTTDILNAYSDVPGTFTYSPALNTVTKVGNLKVKVTFKPTNTALNAVKIQQVTFIVAP